MSEKIFVDEINIGKRFRQDLGDIDALAASIKKKHGLMQPIVVTKRGKLYDLIAGLRRLRAIQKLGWSKIEATIVDLEEGVERLDAEHDENEQHKPFTISERVAIVDKIKAMIGIKQGITSRHLAGSGKSPEEKGGFDSQRAYERAKEATVNGTPETVQAMDEEVIPPSAAAELSKEPPQVQKSVVKKIRKGKAKTVKRALEREPGVEDDDPPVKDKLGADLPPSLVDTFRDDKLKLAKRLLADLIEAVNALCMAPSGKALRQHCKGQRDGKLFIPWNLFYFRRYLVDIEPWAVCEECSGEGSATEKQDKEFVTVPCQPCQGRGWLTKIQHRGKPIQAIRKDGSFAPVNTEPLR